MSYKIDVEDVNQAMPIAMILLKDRGIRRDSRNGPVIELDAPVVTTYHNPANRVLMNPIRDANPFFHFMEGLWMLAGSRKVDFLKKFNSNIELYSDDGNVFHGAYGYRMRRARESHPHGGRVEIVDQLSKVIELLKEHPDSRRAVVQIWDWEKDLCTPSLDIPCNDLIFFKIRDGKLHMTVCCRSNDAIWGAYGANAVHFSMIHEYMASMIGVEQGRYVQISDSLHAYVENPLWESLRKAYYEGGTLEPYRVHNLLRVPLVSKGIPQQLWDQEVNWFVNNLDSHFTYNEPMLNRVAVPMLLAWEEHRTLKNTRSAIAMCGNIAADDWRMACQEWLKRRLGVMSKEV